MKLSFLDFNNTNDSTRYNMMKKISSCFWLAKQIAKMSLNTKYSIGLQTALDIFDMEYLRFCSNYCFHLRRDENNRCKICGQQMEHFHKRYCDKEYPTSKNHCTKPCTVKSSQTEMDSINIMRPCSVENKLFSDWGSPQSTNNVKRIKLNYRKNIDTFHMLRLLVSKLKEKEYLTNLPNFRRSKRAAKLNRKYINPGFIDEITGPKISNCG